MQNGTERYRSLVMVAALLKALSVACLIFGFGVLIASPAGLTRDSIVGFMKAIIPVSVTSVILWVIAELILLLIDVANDIKTIASNISRLDDRDKVR